MKLIHLYNLFFIHPIKNNMTLRLHIFENSHIYEI